MSVYYSVYAEANVDGKWYSLCPYFKSKDGQTRSGSIFWAQSIFYEVDNELLGYSLGLGIPDDMSEGIRCFFNEDLNEEMAGFFGKNTWGDYYRQTLYYVNFDQAIASKVNKDKPYKYEGYVLKRELADFEVYEREEFSEWLTQDEYMSLSEKKRRQYIFHRWNDMYGDYAIYRTIAERIWVLKALFTDMCDLDIGGSLFNGIMDSQIRVYIYRS